MPRRPLFFAGSAILLWASLASLGVKLAHIPAFLLTAMGLLLGSAVGAAYIVCSRSGWDAWRIPSSTVVMGVGGLFGFHFFLFMALRYAPAQQANLINYLWPLLMVVLAPCVLPGVRLQVHHVVAAILGFAAAALTILAPIGFQFSLQAGHFKGYLFALASCMVWASYSLASKRVHPYPSAAIGLFCLLSGLLALLCAYLFEPQALAVLASLSLQDVFYLTLIGLGPLGIAFYAWDAALKHADASQIGILAFLTPVLSTVVLSLTQRQVPHWSVWLALCMLVVACWLGGRKE